ncbi:hypothetical protein ANO14919_073980 [Xylariales sp. No.14919]|nr:hypothetical protein ANO14919_073980 [Xylariales sp. No.14919]
MGAGDACARKRPSAVISDRTNERPLKRAGLTRENLALFNKMAGVEPESASIPSTIKSVSTTASSFAAKAEANNILLVTSLPPTNINDLRECFSKSGSSVSATRSQFLRYSKHVNRSLNEAAVSDLKWHLLKDYIDEEDEDDPSPYYTYAINQQFTNFPRNVGFNDGLSPPQPDFIEGPWRRTFGQFPIEEVSGAVPVKDKIISIALPHIAGEWKANGKDMERARVQSAYDGAALVYARTQALKCLGKSDPPGHAKVITFITDGTILKLYAHYASPSKEGTLEYHQYRIETVDLLRSCDVFNLGRQGLRNLQDYARKEAEALRDALIEHGNTPPDDDSGIAHESQEPRVVSITVSSKLRRGRPPKRKASSSIGSDTARQSQRTVFIARSPKRRRGRPRKRV